MAFNPDSASKAVIAGEEFARIKQVVQSPGDIYEVDESTRAIYIGPDSDIAEVQVVYLQPLETLGFETAIVAVNGPLVGRINALLAQKVSSTGQPGRILISPTDIVNNAYVRPVAGILGGPTRTFRELAQIDVMCAIKDLPAIPAVRADKTFRFPQTPFQPPTVAPAPVTTGATDIIIPFYGRRQASVQITNPIGLAYTAEFYQVSLQPGYNPGASFLGTYNQGGATVPFTRNTVINASQAVQGSIAPQSTSISEIVGQSDLLIVSIAPNGALGAGLHFVDVVIRVSDRET